MSKFRNMNKTDAVAEAIGISSEDEHDKSTPRTPNFSSILSESGSDSDVTFKVMLSSVCSDAKLTSHKNFTKFPVEMPSRPPRTTKAKSRSIDSHFSPKTMAEQASKRHAKAKIMSPSSTPQTYRFGGLKPITPSSTIKSSMNASLVFDMVTSLSTNDPGAAIATLRSVVALGREYPSNLLYAELIDRIQSHETIAYNDAVAIYGALVFVFDKASSCSCALTFPNQWKPLTTALQEVSGNGHIGDDGKPQKDESWRRNLLVVQFYIYCLQQDINACRSRYERIEGKSWFSRTRLHVLLQSDSIPSSSAKARAKLRVKSPKMCNNNLIFRAIGWGLQLWKRVYDDEDRTKKKKDNKMDNSFELKLFLQQEGEQACLAVVRLIEMLYMCTDQHVNALQRIQAGLGELNRSTRIKFAQCLQSPVLRTQLASTMIGLSNKSRNTETEWYDCNALGRVQLAMKPDTSSGLAHTDGYSWSHFDSFVSLKPRSNLTKLLQEISRMQHNYIDGA